MSTRAHTCAVCGSVIECHLAAHRQPDFTHEGRTFWQAPHDHQPRVLLGYHYAEGDPTGGQGQFDVRNLPTYSKFGQSAPLTAGLEAFAEWVGAEQRHHAAIIIAAINDGFDLTSVTYRRAKAA